MGTLAAVVRSKAVVSHRNRHVTGSPTPARAKRASAGDGAPAASAAPVAPPARVAKGPALTLVSAPSAAPRRSDGIPVEHPVSDEDLMEQFSRGDASAFEVLLRRHQRPVLNFIFRYVNNRAVAEDLTQDVFYRIIRRAKTYRRRAKFTTWLYTIARNICVDHSRRMVHRRAASLDQPLRSDGEDKRTLLDSVKDQEADVAREAIGRQLGERIRQAIAELADDQREVFLMRESLGLPFKEIAEIVGIPENTAKSRMRYALEKLRAELAEYEDLARQIG